MPLRSHLNGTIFADHVAGRGPTLVGLHGWGRDRSDLAEALAGREAILFDLPGFGSSPPPPEAWGAHDYAAAVAAALDERGDARDAGAFTLVGHSFGGRVAAHLAAERPDLVSGVVFVGAPLLRLSAPRPPSLWFRALRAASRRGLVPAATMERARQRRGSADYNAAHGVMRDVLVRSVAEDYRTQLSQIGCPTGFCWGANDTTAPPEIARRASELVKQCVALVVVDGAGHDVQRDAVEQFRGVLDDVIRAES
jgi:pimeloyl-ACP methyl ester carboxylesterase